MIPITLLRLAHALGWTREFEEVSTEKIDSDVGEVTRVNFTPPSEGMFGDPHLGLIGQTDGEDSIIVKGSQGEYFLQRADVGECKVGDRVMVRYKTLVCREWDYVPPNFGEKQLIESTDVGVQIENAEVTYSPDSQSA